MADMSAVKRALSQALALVDKADVAGLMGRRGGGMGQGKGGPVSVEVEMGGEGEGEGGEECPECKAGTCTNPEHMTSEDAEGMASMYGGQ